MGAALIKLVVTLDHMIWIGHVREQSGDGDVLLREVGRGRGVKGGKQVSTEDAVDTALWLSLPHSKRSCFCCMSCIW